METKTHQAIVDTLNNLNKIYKEDSNMFAALGDGCDPEQNYVRLIKNIVDLGQH